MTLAGAMTIIELILRLLVAGAEKLTPEQFQTLWDQHEKRHDFYQAIAEKLSEPFLKGSDA